ncbi:Phospholipase A I [Fusarium oxysporum f. sp. raphani]|uniref:Phospholipase A I n=1 Tax=Fusarium oxysporum f. sp. raphani TaxID=96318 RepID=A0A8J5NXU3_FUSOX|nr:Phospholipase A I [Fusarium oxysporum f. sp. raphani]
MPSHDIRLLALDGGGVRGLSSLMILQNLMSTINPDSPPKPCDYFDMISGTSTGGLIAIMLGRLRMTVDECIVAYTSLSNMVFEKKRHRSKINGQLQGRFDATALEQAVKKILVENGHDEEALLKDSSDGACKVYVHSTFPINVSARLSETTSFVCATSKQTTDTVCLTSYRPHGLTHLFDSTTIWQACRATSAATTFFDPIAIGPYGEEFVDGALGANNPVYALWTQAQRVWGDDRLRASLRCLVSIGTGVPAQRAVRDDVLGIRATLTSLATETEKTAEQFRRDKADLDNEGRYYRFNVSHGLEDVGLAESTKQREIAAATGKYVASQDVFRQMKACASGLARKQYGVPASNNFVPRPSDTVELEKCLLPSRSRARQTRRVFVLYGLGGVGKTQLAVDFARSHQAMFSSVFWLDGRSEDQLKQSIAGCIAKIPEGQVPSAYRCWAKSHGRDELDAAVASVIEWLARPDNGDWLLIFDNVDRYWTEQGGTTGMYDLRQYLPGDHGSVLVTTRLSRLAQLGESRRLRKAGLALARDIIERWHGAELDYEQGSVRTTWTVSFREIERQSTDATNLLRLWAFLDNKQLWHGLLEVAAEEPADRRNRAVTAVLDDRNTGRIERQLLDAPGGAPVGVLPGPAAAERMGKTGAGVGGAVGADVSNKAVLGAPAEAAATRGNIVEMGAGRN